ncbi:MAG: type II toxin-antitoxin system RelE/ParE family toxin [Cyclobacteriaceae bacterium]
MKKRELFFFRDYFKKFYQGQTKKVQNKIIWTLRILEEVERIPETYFKHLVSTDGLYEIRVQSGRDIFRVICFFDKDNLVIIGHGFQKKTQKTPVQELERAKKIRDEYYARK